MVGWSTRRGGMAMILVVALAFAILGTPVTAQERNPCYCSQPDSDGDYACFNFNGASSDTNCAPRGNCKAGTAAPGEYAIQSGGSVYQCSVSVPSGSPSPPPTSAGSPPPPTSTSSPSPPPPVPTRSPSPPPPTPTSSPSPPPPQLTPTSPPPPGGQDVPLNPCYCSSPSGSNGGYACFNFNGASSDTNCVPRQNCSPGTAAPGEYGIQAGGSVFKCGGSSG